jgi:hypothetical protein
VSVLALGITRRRLVAFGGVFLTRRTLRHWRGILRFVRKERLRAL